MRPKVWDVFTFHNEIAVLQVRRAELGWGPRLRIEHVPVEATETFTGQPRRQRLAGSYLGVLPPGSCRDRERASRMLCRDALAAHGAQPDDFVVFGDVDEIPSAAALLTAVEFGEPCAMRFPYHSLLARHRLPLAVDTTHHRWPVVGRLGDLDARGTFIEIREGSDALPHNGGRGWHLSSMGGPQVVLDKVGSFGHAGEPWTDGLDVERLRDLARRRRDVADRFDLELAPMNELPRALIDYPWMFRDLLEVCW